MITKFKKYKNKIDAEFNKLLLLAYNKAIQHFLDLHEKVTEDHVYEFINQYLINYYGVNIPNNSKDIVRYVKHLIHKKMKSINK